ncbi:Acetate kinase [Synechococcus sp. MIT S9509]|uniref:acetate/propionate family kinase n=1 Tax=unclassified Synechococcus TaxID=2626047 RepID=UPI0007BBCFB6|nr:MULTISPECIES: acetate kinase [unclassified Synechococcus]KZR85068.1 Acetate kinase [Synechococcus sp. MIT S9504]KZR93804.1 Acetate kinase [Synechococcus sp. MIT S9509]
MKDLALVINLGSSSLKAALVDSTGAFFWRGGHRLTAAENRSEVLRSWLEPKLEPLRERIELIAHRVVHGGEHFTAPTLITTDLEVTLESLVPLAPLHNPPALQGLKWARHWAADRPQWACFDTAFHSTLPAAASTYALPEELRQRGLRRFGFHGINHQHVAEVVAAQSQVEGQHPEQLRLISAHLGAGASLAAIQGGRCIDTTMGFTPLEGLVMATRSGSIDPGLMLELLRQGWDQAQLSDLLQNHAGLKGLSGFSDDMQEIRHQAVQGHEGAQLALDVFRHRLLQLIGAMTTSLKGVDVLALTGGIGEHDKALLSELHNDLGWLPQLKIVVVPADEEGMIARLCRRQSA